MMEDLVEEHILAFFNFLGAHLDIVMSNTVVSIYNHAALFAKKTIMKSDWDVIVNHNKIYTVHTILHNTLHTESYASSKNVLL